jgi:Ca2+-binding RTX toxin-like protein
MTGSAAIRAAQQVPGALADGPEARDGLVATGRQGRHMRGPGIVMRVTTATAAATVALSLLTFAGAEAAPPRSADGRRCTVVGTSGGDVLVAKAKGDVVCGLGGDDVLVGGALAEVLDGGAGDDLLDGGRGADTIKDNNGTDTCHRDDADGPGNCGVGPRPKPTPTPTPTLSSTPTSAA